MKKCTLKDIDFNVLQKKIFVSEENADKIRK